MLVKLNTNLVRLFSGTYETEWEVSETNDEGDELEIDYKFKDLLKSIASVYQAESKYILDTLDVSFISKLRFNGVFYSPREYNFSTDELDFIIDINAVKLQRTLDSLKDSKEFKDFLHDRYSTRDGFWSYTPDNYKDLAKEIKEHGEEFEQSIGALITFLARDRFEEIELQVYEEWACNGYGGLDYTSK